MRTPTHAASSSPSDNSQPLPPSHRCLGCSLCGNTCTCLVGGHGGLECQGEHGKPKGGPQGSVGVKVWDTPGAGSPALNWMGCDGQQRREALRHLRSQETCIYPHLTVCMAPDDGETQVGRPPVQDDQTLSPPAPEHVQGCLLGSWGAAGVRGASLCSQQTKLAFRPRIMRCQAP